jgi:uncharacterized damage-inducible protein DinB
MKLTAAVAAITMVASAVSAQTPNPNDSRALLHGGLREVDTWVTKAAELVPADKYTYKPVATVRTFGELVGHIVDGMNWYCASATGNKVEWSDAVEKGKTDKATVTAALKTAIATCHAVTNTGQMKELMQNIGHTNLHYGNMITYLRMMGMTPPSS